MVSSEFLLAMEYRVKSMVRVILEALIRMVSLNESLWPGPIDDPVIQKIWHYCQILPGILNQGNNILDDQFFTDMNLISFNLGNSREIEGITVIEGRVQSAVHDVRSRRPPGPAHRQGAKGRRPGIHLKVTGNTRGFPLYRP